MENLNNNLKPTVEQPQIEERISCGLCQDVGVCGQCERGKEENRILQESKKKEGNTPKKTTRWY